MTLRYGLIGSGMMGQEHIRNIALLDDCVVTAIADPDAGMLAVSRETAFTSQIQQGRPVHTPQVFNNHADMLAADLCDALVIVSPNDTHHQILKDVMDTGLPVLCEKPLCTTAADCREIVSLAEGRSAPIWVAMEYRYMPPVHWLLDQAHADRAGPLRMMAIREHRFPFLPKIGDWNRFNARTGGTLTEKCCHFWDLMRLVLQADPVRVYASGGADENHHDERYDGKRPDIIDNAFVVVDFDNGTRGMLDLCMFAEGSAWQEVVSVTGPKARLDACVPGPARFAPDGKEREAQGVLSDRATQREIVEPIPVDHAILAAGDHHGSSFYQHQRFADMVRHGGTPEVTLEDGLWSVRVGEAAELSARTGEAVLLKDI